MSSVEWTRQQNDAIETGGRRLLVSAAAGSGKTAVLVERIIRRLNDSEHPVSLDELLVMTFTKAAASEMKAKIRKRIRDPYQIAILDSACISTIDSFCMNVLRDHTDEADIDPAVRVADEAELSLLRADVLEELLDEEYGEASPEFINFVEAYTKGSTGTGLEELILSVYGAAQTSPWPEEWYENISGGDGYLNYIVEYSKQVLRESRGALMEAIRLCDLGDGVRVPYFRTFENDISCIDTVLSAEGYEQFNHALAAFEWERLASASKKLFDEELLGSIKAIRDEVRKKQIEKLQKNFASDEPEVLLDVCRRTAPYVDTIVGLARKFDERFSQKKREKNVIDFNDLEHLVLNIFWDGSGQNRTRSRVAEEYRERFDEIYIDEYQDSNDVQEWILSALDKGRTFMVGDIKQSIYRFRGARPAIFGKKYHEFIPLQEASPADDTRIELSTNFRSRPGILEGVNRLFSLIMKEELGGIGYSDETALHPGPNAEPGGSIKMLLADTGSMEDDDDKRNVEARLVADRIRKLHDEEGVRYSDIVILLRSANKTGEVFLNALMDLGIAAHTESKKGYFDSLEIRTMTALLEAIDNPHKDIPLAAYLRSPMVGMTDSELAMLAGDRSLRGRPLADKLAAYGTGDGQAAADTGRYSEIRERLARYRFMSAYMSMPEFITFLYDDTGYYDYVSTLPAGLTRRANLDKLRSMAADYAQTGYKGLFNFIRFIDTLRTYNTDFGEAQVAGENDDAVRIMSIHKSKGLEFPVCFLSAVDVGFNFRDTQARILPDNDLGIGCEYVDLARRVKMSTLRQNAVSARLRDEELAEEIRVLYVAMTRPKERLYITGAVNGDKKLRAPVRLLRSSASFLDMLLYSGCMYDLETVPASELQAEKSGSGAAEIVLPDRTGSSFEYPYAADVDLHNKMSVSEIKHRWMEEHGQLDEEAPAYQVFKSGENSGAARGTLYHSVMEKLSYERLSGYSHDTENHDPGRPGSDDRAADNMTAGTDEIRAYLEELGDEYRDVDPEDIIKWLGSELGRRFAKASADGRLFRERQFIMGIPAVELGLTDAAGDAVNSTELVLVQGIVDAYFIDDDGLVLVDYKTDRVSCEEQLADRYRAQLDYYARALEKIKGLRVKEKIIWSFALGREVRL